MVSSILYNFNNNNDNNDMVWSNYSYLILSICLYTVIWLYVINDTLAKVLIAVPNVLDCGFKVIMFEQQSRYYVDFWTNMFGQDMKSIILPPRG